MFVYHNFSRVVGASVELVCFFTLLHFFSVVLLSSARALLFICQTLIRAALASLCCVKFVIATGREEKKNKISFQYFRECEKKVFHQ